MDEVLQIRSQILSSSSLPAPSHSLITTVIASRSPPPPFPALVATTKARILAGDWTSDSVLDTSIRSLPAFSATVKEVRLPHDVHVQVLDIEDLSRSRWSQIEELEAEARGEMKQGRKIIRVGAEDDPSGTQREGPTQAAAAEGGTLGGNAMHKLVLQDRKGTKVFAIELKRMSGIGLGKTMIGEKMLLKAGTVVARAHVLLAPENCVLLGGKIDSWHKTWLKERLSRLKAQTSNETIS